MSGGRTCGRPALGRAAALGWLIGGSLIVAGCADDAPPAPTMPAVVAVEAQRCEQPNRVRGVGVVVGDGLVLTAGHTVEGDLRDLTVDGEPAGVVAIDRNLDLAVVAADTGDAPPAVLADGGIPARVTMLGRDGPAEVMTRRRFTLVVEHATDLATYRRNVVSFTPGVTEGTSGSPLVDRRGSLVGIVILNDDAAGEGIAVTADEIAGLLGDAPARDDLRWDEPPRAC